MTPLLSEPVVAVLSCEVRDDELDAFALLAERSVIERSLRRPDKCTSPCKDCGRKPNLSLQPVSLDFRVFFDKEIANRLLPYNARLFGGPPQPSCRSGLQSAAQ